jgi:hypothetical protein
MINNNRKGRATTLSRTLLTAGLLGGASLSLLGAGSAQAAWDVHEPLGYICTVGGPFACGSDPTPTPVARPGSGQYPQDKVLTLLGNTGLLSGDTIAFTIQQAATPNPSWELGLDFELDRTASFNPTGSLDYKVEITDPGYAFQDSQLSSLLSQIPAVPVGPFEVTKSVYSTPFTGTPILTLTNNELPPVAGTLVASNTLPPGLQTIYVRDEWTIPAGSSTILDSIQNNYTQEVPAPLPLLGAGAAFGSIRRLRKLSSQLKSFMG